MLKKVELHVEPDSFFQIILEKNVWIDKQNKESFEE